MRKRVDSFWLQVYITALAVVVASGLFLGSALALDAGAIGTSNKCGEFGQLKRIEYTGTALSALANVPDDTGTAFNCYFNYGYCIMNRTGTGLINGIIQVGEPMNNGAFTKILNGTNSFTLNSTNFESTYRQTFADEGGNTLRLQFNYGVDVTNTIESIVCHFGWK